MKMPPWLKLDPPMRPTEYLGAYAGGLIGAMVGTLLVGGPAVLLSAPAWLIMLLGCPAGLVGSWIYAVAFVRMERGSFDA